VVEERRRHRDERANEDKKPSGIGPRAREQRLCKAIGGSGNQRAECAACLPEHLCERHVLDLKRWWELLRKDAQSYHVRGGRCADAEDADGACGAPACASPDYEPYEPFHSAPFHSAPFHSSPPRSPASPGSDEEAAVTVAEHSLHATNGAPTTDMVPGRAAIATWHEGCRWWRKLTGKSGKATADTATGESPEPPLPVPVPVPVPVPAPVPVPPLPTLASAGAPSEPSPSLIADEFSDGLSRAASPFQAITAADAPDAASTSEEQSAVWTRPASAYASGQGAALAMVGLLEGSARKLAATARTSRSDG